MTDILENLTEPQREAVTHMDGPMLVLAGAGSGKTRVVTRRIAYLISKGVWPEQILAMTFTNKAAREMQERVEALTGSQARWVGTFHSTCARFLRRDVERLQDGRTGNYSIFDAGDQQSLVKLCLRELDVSDKEMTPQRVANYISRQKTAMIPPDVALTHAASYQTQTSARAYGLYELRLRELNAVDFDDLLLLTVRILEDNPELQDIYRSRFRYLLIDEYQDTNRIQYRLMQLLTGPAKNVHVTGDPDQSIYSWRGACYRNIMDFTVDFPTARVIRLEQNYRSTQPILDAANMLIRNNQDRFEKELFTDRTAGPPVRVVAVPGDREEAAWVAERIVQLTLEGYALSDMAVFYRTNAQSRPFEEALLRATIPYQVVGGLRFFDRLEVKDVLAHLHIMANPRDALALQRVVGCRSTGVGSKSLQTVLDRSTALGIPPVSLLCDPDFPRLYGARCSAKLIDFSAWCRRLVDIPLTPVGDCVEAAVHSSGLIEHFEDRRDKDPLVEDRIENIESLVNRAYQFGEDHPNASLHDFLADVALVSDVDYHDGSANAVSLMTLHSSKGLEFPIVFIVGVEEKLLPHANSMDDPEAVEEERRLLYVGITRGKDEVSLLHAQQRFAWGATHECQSSRFLRELPGDGLDYVDLAYSRSNRFAW